MVEIGRIMQLVGGERQDNGADRCCCKRIEGEVFGGRGFWRERLEGEGGRGFFFGEGEVAGEMEREAEEGRDMDTVTLA
jgi:hypothetical protein